MSNEKKKIIILGGGMASLSAAHELTDYEDWQDKYEITVYQTARCLLSLLLSLDNGRDSKHRAV